MEHIHPLDFRALEFEKRELLFDVFAEELEALHGAGFVHRDLRRPSELEGQYLDNILLTASGLRRIGPGVSALREEVGNKLFEKFAKREREELALFNEYFLNRTLQHSNTPPDAHLCPPMHRFLQSFRRQPSSGRYVPELDGLRFVATLIVVSTHAFLAWMYGQHQTHESLEALGWHPALLHLMRHNATMLLIFFALSGYVLAMPFARAASSGRRVSMRNYFLRRLTRIEPPYLIVTTGFLLIYLLDDPNHIHYYGPHYLASIGYLHNVIFPYQNGLNDVAWSLEVEAQFYIVAPVIFLLFRLPVHTRRWIFPLLTVAASVAPLLWPTRVITLYNFLGYTLTGVTIANALASGWKPGRLATALIAAAAGASWILFLGGGVILSEPVYLALRPLPVAAVLTAVLVAPAMQRPLRVGVLPVIGGMSYSIYLIHNLLIVFLVKYHLLPGLDSPTVGAFVTMLVASLGCVLVVGALVFKIAEQPFMRFSSRFPLFRRHPAPPADNSGSTKILADL